MKSLIYHTNSTVLWFIGVINSHIQSCSKRNGFNLNIADIDSSQLHHTDCKNVTKPAYPVMKLLHTLR